MPSKICAYIGCGYQYRYGHVNVGADDIGGVKHCSPFLFPRNEALFEKWAIQSGRSDFLGKNKHLSKARPFLCDKHFRSEDLENRVGTVSNRLKKGSIPVSHQSIIKLEENSTIVKIEHELPDDMEESNDASVEPVFQCETIYKIEVDDQVNDDLECNNQENIPSSKVNVGIQCNLDSEIDVGIECSKDSENNVGIQCQLDQSRKMLPLYSLVTRYQ